MICKLALKTVVCIGCDRSHKFFVQNRAMLRANFLSLDVYKDVMCINVLRCLSRFRCAAMYELRTYNHVFKSSM